MLSEDHISGILFAPIVTDGVLGALIFVPVRYLLGRFSLLERLWHTALFELALYVCITGTVVLLIR